VVAVTNEINVVTVTYTAIRLAHAKLFTGLLQELPIQSSGLDRKSSGGCNARQRGPDRSSGKEPTAPGAKRAAGPPERGSRWLSALDPPQRWSLKFSPGVRAPARGSVLSANGDFTREFLSLITSTPISDLRAACELGAVVRRYGKAAAMVPRIITSRTGARVTNEFSSGNF
jgi:hypothetical protein